MLQGTIDPHFGPVAELLEKAIAADPEYAFQLAIYQGSRLVADVYAGEGLSADTLMVPFSVSKNSVAFSVALLVDRGELDLDAPVAHYWPEFAAEGKQDVRVRDLLSHQAGLVEARPRLTDEEYADPTAAAARLAALLPWWRPGSAFGYHGVTIGTLGGELVRRVTGREFREFFETEIRAARGLDFYLGTTPELEERVVELLPMIRSGPPAPVPFVRTPGQLGRIVFAGATAQRSPEEQLAFSRRSREIGNPATSATVSARGIAGLFAECVVGLTGPALISSSTLERMAQPQVAGTDAVIGIERSYGIVFQKPTSNLAFGSYGAFGHDGAGGALGYHDPLTGISLGYTVRRTPPPGGADPRVLAIAGLLSDLGAEEAG